MKLLSASTSSYPRIGDRPEQQQHRQAYAQHERGGISDEEFERVQDEVTRGVIEEQVRAGLDVVTDGQVRWHDPISHFVRKLEGCEINGLLRFFDTNFYFRQPIIRGKLVKHESVLKREFTFARGISKSVKPVVTGPYTLARLSINRRGDGFQPLVDEFASVISQEVRDLAEAGAELIQIDEPAILKNPTDFQVFEKIIQKIVAEKGDARVALYMYFGDAMPLYQKLLKLPVDVLGLDFTYSPKLPDAIARFGCDKELGVGLIDGRNTRLERENEVMNVLKLILPAIKSKCVYLNPSCGLGDYLSREVAFKKIQNMASIAENARELI